LNKKAQKSSDLFMKCRYLDEITNGKGTVFATGTPVSNSMVELYTMQRYLQYDGLRNQGLEHFDNWASTFGETVTAIELAPEGTGYRSKTRFAKFHNLPELMALFKEVADIQTADTLNLPTPEFENINDATTALVAMSAAYADAEKDIDKMDIVDRLNLIGNNYAIATDELATALQDGAATLQTAGNDLDQAIALTTAGNEKIA